MENVDKKSGQVFDDRLATYNERGEELLDPRPMALPVGFKHPKTLQERMRELLRSEEIRRFLDAKGEETFEEADDFDVGEEDPLKSTPYEDDFEPEIPGLAAREQEIRAGAVLDRDSERKEKAREVVRKWRTYKKNKLTSPKKNGKIPPSENDEKEEENDQEESTS